MSVPEFRLVVEGVDETGEESLPGDWVDWISKTYVKQAYDHRPIYRGVRPVYIEKRKCLLVEPSVQKEEPELYEHILRFVRTHRLMWRMELAAGALP